MAKIQKAVTIILWSVLVCAMLGVVGFGMWGRSASRADLPILYEAAPFALVNQDNQPVTDRDLRGNVWVAAFIFTHCAGPCPMMSARMAQLQSAVPDKDVKLVSFTVDPDRDTPAVLKEYAQRFNADESRWYFLTGEKQAIFNFVYGMKL